MLILRLSAERGRIDHGWLDTRHTFSFGDYRDPQWMGYRNLRVINEDFVAAGHGFPTHPHRDMEIVTWVLSGSLAHKDSTGGGGVIRPGDAQHMTAGRGVQHSEFNGSADEPCHLLQIWILPMERGLDPAYHQQHFPEATRRDQLRAICAPGGADGALPLSADARIFNAVLSSGAAVRHELAPGRGAWLQVARGSVSLNGTTLGTGDGAAVEDEAALAIEAAQESEVLLFDLG